MENARCIRVTGTGSLKLKPDTTRISLTVRGTHKEYAETLERSSEDTEALRKTLGRLGFSADLLKTVSFNVDPRYEGYNDKNGNYRERFKGYEFIHSLKLEFPSDNDLLGRTLYALAHSPVKPEFRIGYTVKDKESAKNELIAKAVADAFEKAKVLAKASGVSLGEIQSIDYSLCEPSFEVRPVNVRFKASMAVADCGEEECAYGLDINPEDITVNDTVTIVWLIS